MPFSGDDPDAALQRLQSMGRGGADAEPSFAAEPVSAAAPGEPRVYAPKQKSRAPRARTKPAASGGGRAAARIAAPVIFLVCVIALVSIAVRSGVIGGADTAKPTPAATSTKGTKQATKKYVVKSGDTLSVIATKFDTTVTVLQELNPNLGTTLVVGTKIKVPK